jgi:MFS family permease
VKLINIAGPGDIFITNLGTILGTLYPPATDPSTVPTTAATHVSIVAFTSTIARIIFGVLTDKVAPVSVGHPLGSVSNSLASLPAKPTRVTISRMYFLLLAALFFILGQVLLASGLIQGHSERFWMVSSLIGSGYGALYSLTPTIIAVIWGVENFGTNWGIVAMVPSLGALVWGVIYSKVYQWGVDQSLNGAELADELLCYGQQCYAATFWAMATSVTIGCGLWIWAWKGRSGWSQRGIPV